MITFYNELPLDHKKSLSCLLDKCAGKVYDKGSHKVSHYEVNYCYEYEQAWNSIGEHLWNEGHIINIPVGKTFWEIIDE